MYTPAIFSETDDKRIASLIEEYGFATVISSSATGLQITHAPVQLDRHRGELGTLIGHVAQANPHAELLIDGAEVLVIFHGPHRYISPTWYADENSRDPNVPTWNYVAVHVHGRVRRIHADLRKWKIVTDLATQYEGSSARPWNSGDLSRHASKLDAIVGFEVAIDRIEGKTKLSQNRSVADQEKVIAQLEAGAHPDGHAIARLMRENIARKRNP